MLNKIKCFFKPKNKKVTAAQNEAEKHFNVIEDEEVVDKSKIETPSNNPIEEENKTRLIITFRNNTVLSFSNTVLNPRDFPWKKFYVWYLSKNTPLYNFTYRDGDYIIKRSEISLVERRKNF